ncbi:hypothetical protein C4K04_3683 [Pseudomonas chlororaphis]|uniref:Uncharacterized protein n=1 Tax=Pseudomonas chlororaphis TaxID=587753 RepID=A0A3G7TQG2_9PSED|nr:hypothetical protein C4K04_3683 [Pseudomonas chlororaphis]
MHYSAAGHTLKMSIQRHAGRHAAISVIGFCGLRHAIHRNNP